MARRWWRAIPVVLAVAVVAVGVSFGFGSGGDPVPADAATFRPESAHPPVLEGGWPYEPPPVKPFDFSVGEAQVPDLRLYEFPGVPYGPQPVVLGSDVEPFDVVFPVVATDNAWLRVRIQVNESERRAFVNREDMTVLSSSSMLVIERSLGRLTLFEGDEVRFAEPAAVGAPETPTPTGAFYVERVLDTPDDGPDRVGVVSLGTFTDIVDRTPTLGPVIGATNDPAVPGEAVTSGGIAVSDEVMVQLLALVKPGTPVHILP